MTVGSYDGRPALVGGTSRPAIHGWCVILGDGGRLLGHYSRPDLINWSNPSQFRDLRLADVDGDGRAEAVAALDTDCRQLIVYRPDGKILWDADVAGAAEAVAVRPATAGRAARSVLCVECGLRVLFRWPDRQAPLCDLSGPLCRLRGPVGRRPHAGRMFVGRGILDRGRRQALGPAFRRQPDHGPAARRRSPRRAIASSSARRTGGCWCWGSEGVKEVTNGS